MYENVFIHSTFNNPNDSAFSVHCKGWLINQMQFVSLFVYLQEAVIEAGMIMELTLSYYQIFKKLHMK